MSQVPHAMNSSILVASSSAQDWSAPASPGDPDRVFRPSETVTAGVGCPLVNCRPTRFPCSRQEGPRVRIVVHASTVVERASRPFDRAPDLEAVSRQLS